MDRASSCLTLRSLFELRKSLQFHRQQRISQGRYFVYDERPGFADSTGILWPVWFVTGDTLDQKATLALQSGDLLTFSASIHFQSSESSSKYNDSAFSLHVESILAHTPAKGSWWTSEIPSPIPEELPQRKAEQGTLYFEPVSCVRHRTLYQREQALRRLRRFFRARGFQELDTPILVPSGGMEVYLNPFATAYTDHRGHSSPLQLPTSPELSLKKLITEGRPRVFQIAKSFRNQGELGRWHEPEFLMLEWYQFGLSFDVLMETTEDLVIALAELFGASDRLPPKPWPRYSVTELLKVHAGMELSDIQDLDVFRKAACQVSRSCQADDSWDTLFSKVFMDCIEPWLIQQTACFIFDFPKQMPGLAKVEGLVSKRVELYMSGVEMSNGYEELTDSDGYQVRKTMASEGEGGCKGLDPIFMNAMQAGLPHCVGNALGIERLIAILLNRDAISEVIPLPFLSQFVRGQMPAE